MSKTDPTHQHLADLYRSMLLRADDRTSLAYFFGPRGPKGLTPESIEKTLDKFSTREALRVAREDEVYAEIPRGKPLSC